MLILTDLNAKLSQRALCAKSCDVTSNVTSKKSETEIFESPQSVLHNSEHILKDVFSSRSYLKCLTVKPVSNVSVIKPG